MAKKKKKNISRGEKIRRLIMTIAVIVAASSLGYFGYYCFLADKSSSEFENLSQLKNTDFEIYKSDKNKDDNNGKPNILDDYKTLYNKNKNLIGWLKIADTTIDYPVMQCQNQEYYLDHNFNQEEDRNGTLFIDKDCSVWPRTQNIIIYGHNMKSGKMFGALKEYKSESFYKKHPMISFDTLYEKGEYEVMFVFSETVHEADEVTFRYYQFINANSEEEYNSNMEAMKEMSLYDTGVHSRYGDKLITLSTCDYTAGAERFAVVARRVR